MTEVTVGNSEDGFTEINNAEQFRDKDIVVKGAYSVMKKLKNSEE